MQLFGVLFLAEIVAGIYLLIVSPKKLQTLGRMALGFVMAMLIFMLLPAVLRRGDPRAWGQLAGVIAPPVAVIVGWLNVRSLRRSAAIPTSAPPSS